MNNQTLTFIIFGLLIVIGVIIMWNRAIAKERNQVNEDYKATTAELFEVKDGNKKLLEENEHLLRKFSDLTQKYVADKNNWNDELSIKEQHKEEYKLKYETLLASNKALIVQNTNLQHQNDELIQSEGNLVKEIRTKHDEIVSLKEQINLLEEKYTEVKAHDRLLAETNDRLAKELNLAEVRWTTKADQLIEAQTEIRKLQDLLNKASLSKAVKPSLASGVPSKSKKGKNRLVEDSNEVKGNGFIA